MPTGFDARVSSSEISDDSAPILRPNPTGRYLFFTVAHEKNLKPIYPERLSIAQVVQGARSGDCYLLAVINAIIALPGGEQYIREAMIDKQNTLYVRFFKDDCPQWQIIEKSLPTSWGILSSGNTWVRFLEKAYVAFMGGNYNKTLTSGDSRIALKTFLGGFNEAIPTSEQARRSLTVLYKSIIYGCDGKDIYSLIFLMRPHDKLADIQNMSQYIFSDKPELLKAWWHWAAFNKNHFERLLENNPVLTHEIFINFINDRVQNSINPPVDAIEAVKKWVHAHSILPCEDRYSYDELKLFALLKKAHNEQRPCVCSPKEDPPEGITLSHTYALIGIRESRISHRKFVILRNPHSEERHWLSYYFLSGGRHSKELKNKKSGKVRLSISPVNESTFTMELRDFAHAFAYIDCGRSLLDKGLMKQLEEHPYPMALNTI